MTPTLDEALATAFACLAEGAADPTSVWHTPTLANVDQAGVASQRSVVLRAWDPAVRTLDIHTDTRSAKHDSLRDRPKASLHVWDAARKIQLRMDGTVRPHTADAVAQAAWARLRPASRATYGVIPGPGTPLRHPSDTRQAEEVDGFAVFCVVRLTLVRLDWLHLGQGSHARAQFHWDNGVATSIWVVP